MMDNTLQGAFYRLISAAEGLGIAIATTSGLGSGLQGSLNSLASDINTLTDNVERALTVVGNTATFVGVLLAGRFVVQTVAAVGALKGLTAGAIALRVGLISLSGPGGWIFIAASALGFLVANLFLAEKETTALAKSVNELLNRTQPANFVSALEASIKRYEERIIELREVLARPVTTEFGASNISRRREELAQFETDLAALRMRLAGAQEDAVSEALTLPVAPPVAAERPAAPAPSRIARARRDFGGGIGAAIARESRASRQRIALLMAEGAERLRLEARFAVANRFADEQIRLSAALAIAKGAEREGLLAEQAALDRNVKSIDSLIAAKLEQLTIDQRAARLASFQRTIAEREAPQLIVSPLPDVIPGLAEALRAEEEAARLAAQHVDITRVAVDALSDGLANAAAHARSLGDALRSIALTVTGSLLRTFLPGLIAGAFGGGGGGGGLPRRR